jgi:hypothetical protein
MAWTITSQQAERGAVLLAILNALTMLAGITSLAVTRWQALLASGTAPFA